MKQLKLLSTTTDLDRMYSHKFYKHMGVKLTQNKPIAKGVVAGERFATTDELGLPDVRTGRDRSYESRVAEGGLQKGIQYYRMWFRFLKLGLECERKKIEIVSAPPTYEIRRAGNTDLKFHIPRELIKVKVNKKFYKDWDLDAVYEKNFDWWWKRYGHIFQSSKPEIIQSKKISREDGFIYLKIDETFNYEDLVPFLSREVRPLLRRPKKYEIKGKGRYGQLIPRYNALVLSMSGMSPRDALNSPKNYFPAPDEKGDRVDRGGSISIPSTKGGTLHYSKVFRRYYDGGLQHLRDVCEGKFGRGVV